MNKFGLIIVFIFITYILTTIFSVTRGHKLISGDGRYYYAWLHTIIFDRNLDFTNEYHQLHINDPYTWADQNLPAVYYAPGSALLWSPFYMIAYLINKTRTGYELFFQLFVSIGTMVYVIIGCILLHHVLIRYFTDYIAGITIICICLTTNIYYYSSISPAYPHGITFFLTSLLIWLLEIKANIYITGLVLGLLYLTRLQDLIIIIITIPYLSKSFKNYLKLILPLITFILFQTYIWYLIYGKLVFSPYLSSSSDLFLKGFNLIDVLFSWDYGLFIKTPVLVLSVIGFIFLYNKVKIYKYFLLALFIQLLLISLYSNPGGSYSHRYFTTFLPFFAFGLAGFWERLSILKINKIIINLLLGIFVIYNIFGTLKYHGLI